MKTTAIAFSNIALVKYWGKRDENIILPYNSSISMTLDKFFTKTTIDFSDEYKNEFYINGQLKSDEKVDRFMQLISKIKVIKNYKIMTENNFPTSAGFASSASGFAALSATVNSSLKLNLDKKHLSILARQGSGSASRSIHGGFVIWNKGEKSDGTDSFAQQLFSEDHWPELKLIACITQTEEKSVSSRNGMKQSVQTSPMYQNWLDTIDEDIHNVKKALESKDFKLLGETAEKNALKMHDIMHTTVPKINYWNKKTVKIMDIVKKLRTKGIRCYFTIDGGPQVKILCLEKDVDRITKEIPVEYVVCGVGPGYKLSKEHLF